MFAEEASRKTFMFGGKPRSKILGDCRVEVLHRYNNRCCYCGHEGGSVVVDLIIPKSKLAELGRNEYSLKNMALACTKCNNAKGAQLYTPDSFDETYAPEICKREYREYYEELFT